MNINDYTHKTNYIKASCQKCAKNNVCKYKEDFEEVSRRAEEIIINKFVPFELSANCNEFDEAKYNGFNGLFSNLNNIK